MELSTLNEIDQKAFTHALGEIFEHSPWIPFKTWKKRPFSSLDNLHEKLFETLLEATEEEQLTLIRAHPDLAGKLAIAGELSEFSTSEQQSASLNKLSPEQFQKISTLNLRYKDLFQFPFIICVKDHTQTSIFENFEARLNNDKETEMTAALEQISRIAWHRLNNLLQ